MKTTLETSEENLKLNLSELRKYIASFYFQKKGIRLVDLLKYTRFECSFLDIDRILRNEMLCLICRSGKIQKDTLIESTLVEVFESNLLHPFRVWFQLFLTRFECVFNSFSLVLSVIFQGIFIKFPKTFVRLTRKT